MFIDRSKIRGKVTAKVLGPDGKLKRRDCLSFRQFLIAIWAAKWRVKELITMLRFEYSVNHNIVTDQGDAFVADRMISAPTRTHIDNVNGQITVGTGWTGINTKQNTGVNTPVGSPDSMESGYPQLKGSWGSPDDNVVQYRVIFSAGTLNSAGIDEAELGNATDNLAYGQISPSVTVSTLDTLQVDWEITFLGA